MLLESIHVGILPDIREDLRGKDQQAHVVEPEPGNRRADIVDGAADCEVGGVGKLHDFAPSAGSLARVSDS